jgi:hypothetical protein
MKQLVIYCLTAMLLLAGCGTSRLVTKNSEVDIYVDNHFKGKGQATITRTGPPEKVHIEAKYHDQIVGSIDVRRHIDAVTMVTGLYYGIGFIFAWRYPETIEIPIKDITETKQKGFDASESIWDLPPGEWKKAK